MRAQRRCKYLLGLLCAASTCSANGARADEIAPPEKNPYAPINVPIIGTSAADAPAIIEKLRSGDLTAEAAWQSGELKLDDVLYLLGEYFDPWGGIDWKGGGEIRLPLAKLIVEHAPEKLQKPNELPLRARLWIADYYVSIDNDRALELAESVIAEVKPNAKEHQPLIFLSVERIAWLHQNRRDYQKAAETWLRLEPLLGNKSWMVTDAVWLAGRNLLYMGDEAAAQKLFAHAQSHQSPFYTMMVDYDLSGLWMKRGQYERVQRMQQKALQNETDPVNRAMRFLSLAQALYQMGEWDKAADAAQQVLAESAKEPNPNPYLGIEFAQNGARSLIQWSALWQKTPAIHMPQELKWHINKNANTNPARTLSARLTIRTPQETELKVSASDGRVKWKIVAPEKDPWIGGRASSDYVERWIEVEVPSDLAKAQTLKIEMPKLKNHSIAVPLKIEE